MKFYNELIDRIKNGIPTKLSRWGDGEWGCMYGVTGENRDGNKYLPEMGFSLRVILNSQPEYYMGLQYGVLYNEQLRDYVFGKIFKLDINWVNGDILHQASEYRHLKKFTDALRGRNVVVIGAEYFKILPYNHITIPESNSFLINLDLFRELRLKPNDVVLVAAAMNSNVIIDRLPDNVTAIDIGSVFDPYLGRPRASYQYKMNVTLKDLF